jgi:hypothetical protein
MAATSRWVWSTVKPGRVKASAAVRISASDQPRAIQWPVKRTRLSCQWSPARMAARQASTVTPSNSLPM